MPDLKIENDLMDKTFLYRQSGEVWQTIPVSNPPTVISSIITKERSYLFTNEGGPINDNSIFIGLKGCTHCLEIIDVVTGSNSYNTLFKFSPIEPIAEDLVVKSQKVGVTTINTYTGECKVYYTNKLYLDCIINAKISNNPTIPSVTLCAQQSTPLHLHTFPSKEAYEFNVMYKSGENGRHLININIDKLPYTILKFGMKKTKVLIEHGIVGPQNINITIVPD